MRALRALLLGALPPSPQLYQPFGLILTGRLQSNLPYQYSVSYGPLAHNRV